MDLFELIKDAINPYLDGEKPPLHIGEAMNLWFYMSATEQTMRGEQVAYNTVQDKDLRDKIEDVINNVHKPIREELLEFMKKEGVPLPNAMPEKTIGDFRSMPASGKLSDEEAANLLSFNIVLGITYACRGLTESVRPDVSAMFAKFLVRKVAFSITFKDLMTKKGWLLVPPTYTQAMPPNT